MLNCKLHGYETGARIQQSFRENECMVAGLCHFVFASFHEKKLPRKNTKYHQEKRRNPSREKTRFQRKKTKKKKKKKKKTTCEKTLFQTLICRVSAWSLFVFSRQKAATQKDERTKRRQAKRRKYAMRKDTTRKMQKKNTKRKRPHARRCDAKRRQKMQLVISLRIIVRLKSDCGL